ncbi:MAG: Dabb family protein [Barnesiella sp.]|nr:Dabb family protein [Barnesiella sp.]
MVKHIVMFQFEGSDDQRLAVARKFRDALIALPAQIDQLKSIEVGININPAEQWDLVLTAVADSMEDVAAYSAHPAHVAAVGLIAGHKKSRACVDYIIEE